MSQLTNRVKTTLCKTAVAAGTTDITDATAIDMTGFEGVRFIYSFGAITSGSVSSVAAAGLDTSSPTPGTDDLAGTKIAVADTADDTLFILDIYKPRQRYIRPFVKRATQNAVLNSIVAEQYGHAGLLPITKDATVTGQELWVSPAAGTA
jgi:hypothetical protein